MTDVSSSDIFKKHVEPDIPMLSAIAGRSVHVGNHNAKLIYGGMVVAQASNTFFPISNISILKTKKGRSKYSIHAEHNVIQAYLAMLVAKNKISAKHRKNIQMGKLRDCTLIVYSVTKSGKLRESTPCSSCVELLDSLGIKDVYYSNKEGLLVYSLVSDLTSEPSSGIRRWSGA